MSTLADHARAAFLKWNDSVKTWPSKREVFEAGYLAAVRDGVNSICDCEQARLRCPLHGNPALADNKRPTGERS